MDIQSLFKNPHKLKVFFTLLIITLFALLLINFMLLPYIFTNSIPSVNKMLTDLVSNLTTVVASSIATALFLYIITPKVMNKSEIHIVDSYNLKNTLNKITNNTSAFTYYGHTARWNRSVTLPKLLKEAESEHITKNIEIIIIDPDNIEATEYYSKFGHGKRSNGNDVGSSKAVKMELLTTILAMYEYQKSAFLDITVYLSSNISLFRIDLTDNALILTKPYSEEPALLFYEGSFFYKSYKEEVKIAKEQSTRLSLYEIESIDLTHESCKNILDNLGLDSDNLTEDDIDTVLNRVKNPISPY